MNKQQFLSSLEDVWCRLAVTKHGVGVVAIRDIPEGVNPFKNCDPHGGVLEIAESELDANPAPAEAKQLVRDFCALQDGVYFVPDYGIDAIDKSYFLNHSEKPNMTTHDRGENFVTARKIKKGEELVADYGEYHEYVKTFTKKQKHRDL
ncbi:MAG TPA: SET domain-containing protein [Candidatus Paceibacterota bacterium]|nr:SET domain-containing protein [Candidatus Paceibacterota bacterium]